MGTGNEIFKDVSSLHRILCPSNNAFDVYNKIFDEIILKSKKSDLILISMGPTATVLAYELSLLGYWVIDIGHLDIEYEWMKNNVQKKVNLHNRKAWEVGNHEEINKTLDEQYLKTIISKITINE